MIQVDGLSKYYAAFPAVQDLAFEARAGEILGFLGPNGAGKTTTMRILAGFMPPSSGTARVAGFDVVDDSLEVRKRVGYLPETVPLYPEMSVREYLAYMGSLRRVENLDDRILETLDEVHLLDRAESFIGNLSKGLRQRVGLAQALLHRPQVLILDEPTIGLDPAQILEVRKLIESLKGERTILLSTHILSEAQQVCDRVLIINRGRIVAEDTPENLRAQLAGADRLRVMVGGPAHEALRIAKGIPGVASAVAGERAGEILVASKPGEDIRAELARAIVAAGLDLLELGSVGMSLEQIFLQLTQEESPISPEG
jgi:ABC-2 type transport system ATP-binding protein